VFGLSFLLNLVQRRKLPLSSQCMLWFSGLRGAVAFALAVEDANTPEARFVLSTTLFLVVVTVFVCGSLAVPVAEHFQARGKLGADNDQRSMSTIDLGESELESAGPGLAGPDDEPDLSSRKVCARGMQSLGLSWRDQNFFPSLSMVAPTKSKRLHCLFQKKKNGGRGRISAGGR
jgi:hypothetical protein